MDYLNSLRLERLINIVVKNNYLENFLNNEKILSLDEKDLNKIHDVVTKINNSEKTNINFSKETLKTQEEIKKKKLEEKAFVYAVLGKDVADNLYAPLEFLALGEPTPEIKLNPQTISEETLKSIKDLITIEETEKEINFDFLVNEVIKTLKTDFTVKYINFTKDLTKIDEDIKTSSPAYTGIKPEKSSKLAINAIKNNKQNFKFNEEKTTLSNMIDEEMDKSLQKSNDYKYK